MLETIRQFAEEQLVARGEAATVRSAHARHFAQRETDLIALWDSPRQREVHDWLATELANLRTAFRWAADHGDLDGAAAIASYAGFIGLITEKYEPFGWAEELIEPARAADHPRLAELYTVAAQCFLTGRVDDGVRYTDAARLVLTERSEALPSFFEVMIGGAYTYIGHPEECVEWCRAQLRDCPDSVHVRAYLVVSLVNASPGAQATAATSGLIEAAEATANPLMLSFALLACSYAFREVDPARAVDAARRGLVIAHDSANRYFETQLAIVLGGLEAEDGDIGTAFDHLSLAISHMHDSGETSNTPLAVLAALFGRLGRHEAAATIAGFALSPITAVGTPEIKTAITHLRQVLGDHTYESLAHTGEMMATAEMVTYAYDQIERARAELSAVSE
jgi:hypothetical protein